MNQNDEEALRNVLKRSYAHFVEEELLDETDRDLLKRAFPGQTEVENVLFAVRNDLENVPNQWQIHSEWNPNIPPDDTVIRRYLRLERFESLLDESGLWFSRVDGFSDEFEGTLPEPNAKLRGDSHRRLRERRDDKTYINCWRIGEGESAVFWNAYIGNEPGLAVETTVGDFRKAVKMKVSDGYVERYQEYVSSTGTERAEALEDVYEELSKLQIGEVEYVSYDETPIPGS